MQPGVGPGGTKQKLLEIDSTTQAVLGTEKMQSFHSAFKLKASTI